MRVAEHFRLYLIKTGERLPVPLLDAAGAGLKYLRLGKWLRDRGFEKLRLCEGREAIFLVAAQELGHRQTCYLEFGVFQGASMRYWSQALRHPASVLYGFDTFEGLPEAWHGRPRGYFSTDGSFPAIDDPRVHFIKGLFQDTLRGFKVPEHQALFVNLDADLYSSTSFVLKQLRTLIRPGTYLYFDEFSDYEHEFRAFDEFLDQSRLSFDLLAVGPRLRNALFRCR